MCQNHVQTSLAFEESLFWPRLILNGRVPSCNFTISPSREEVTQKAKNDPRLTQSEPLEGHIQEGLKAWRVARAERLSAVRD